MQLCERVIVRETERERKKESIEKYRERTGTDSLSAPYGYG